MNEATKGMKKLDLRELELKDLEVARKLQEEEIKVKVELTDSALVGRLRFSCSRLTQIKVPLQLNHGFSLGERRLFGLLSTGLFLYFIIFYYIL